MFCHVQNLVADAGLQSHSVWSSTAAAGCAFQGSSASAAVSPSLRPLLSIRLCLTCCLHFLNKILQGPKTFPLLEDAPGNTWVLSLLLCSGDDLTSCHSTELALRGYGMKTWAW